MISHGCFIGSHAHKVKSEVNGLYSTMCTIVQGKMLGFFAAFSIISM